MLYHFSEEPDIEVFKPLKSKSYPEMNPAVWAIDEEHKVHYFLPRDCPRVIFTKSDQCKQEDLDQFFKHSTANRILAVENRWFNKIRETKLYVYTFSEEHFVLFDEGAGYYISYNEVLPIKVEPVGDLIEKILETGTELRFTPNLFPLRNAIIQSSLNFSIIRFRNAVEG